MLDRLLQGWVIATLSKEVLPQVVNLKTFVELWLALQNIFAKVLEERELLIFLQMQKCHKDNFSSLHKYPGIFQRYFNEIFAIDCPLEEKKKGLFV